jgi:serine/threonine protein phosphatase 1
VDRNQQKFGHLQAAQRIWAIASVHGDALRLGKLHDRIWGRLAAGDQVVYLGNLLGRGPAVSETLDHAIAFRRAIMSVAPAEQDQVIFLRGAQEEMWQKLLQLQFATDPRGVLTWMFDQGVGATLEAYGGSQDDAFAAAKKGAIGLTRWTQALRAVMSGRPGHMALMSALKRACTTDNGPLLFVNSGLDPSRPLDSQRDSFWWASSGFARIAEPYGNYKRILRGFDPAHPGLAETRYTVTLDGGCGFGGPLLAACLSPDGEILHRIEV